MTDRLDILLVQPLGFSTEAAERDIARKANLLPPLGLASIAAYLERAGLRTAVLDCNAWPNSDARLLELLRDRRPGWIGFSCTTPNFLDGVRLAEMARAESPGIRTVFGGPHASALADTLLTQFPAIDYLVVGEGEETLRQLIDGGGEGDVLPGVVRRCDGGTEFGGHREALVLDQLPLPAYEQLAGFPDAYQLPIFNYPTTPNTSCISSRGCPYACSYCDRSVFRRTFRYNSADYLYEHLRYLRERFGIRHINFYDDQFTFHRQRVVEVCTRLIEEPLGMSFNCAVRAEHIDPELLQLMKQAGCWMASLGIETGDPDLLAQHRQNADLQMLREAVEQIRGAGIRTKGLLMLGLPGETETSVRRSMAYVRSLRLDDFNLAKFTPFPGTPLYESIHDLGSFEEDWEKMDCMHFQFVPHGISRERLEQLFIEFYKRHFQQPRVLLGYLAMLWKSPDSWKRFLGNLGSFLRFARSNERLVKE
ncbi:MAG: B12-binding domain-containing radical SAM protein [Desulfuromonas sp.]|nr:MAG: B12-binding domain-containing radical SAM protein [Desulfuromonas sp.]